MSTPYLLDVNNLTVREAGSFILRDISFRILPAECWAFRGKSGSGKSTLLRCIRNYKLFPGRIRVANECSQEFTLISHYNRFRNLSGVDNFYYQQRFNASESADSLSVMEGMLSNGGVESEAIDHLDRLQIAHLKDMPMIRLSNGEHKRYQLAKAIFEKAGWLLLDDPYIGLDVAARKLLGKVFADLRAGGLSMTFVLTNEIPEFVTHIATLDNGILTGVNRREKQPGRDLSPTRVENDVLEHVNALPSLADANFEYAISMKNVSVMYGARKILQNINWKVRKGEKWSISGHNGSGKSTLLSLVNGDNPQAFANEIYLFDRKRGSGESIWDIKSMTGYVSPELHHYFDKSQTCFNVVASGLFDTIGLFRKLDNKKLARVNAYVEIFDLQSVSRKSLGSVSHGMQRWVLLARAFIKNPPLLILDEPCQGLDDELSKKILAYIDTLCTSDDKTLLYVSHIADKIPACVNQSLTLEQGKIIEIKDYGKEYNGHSGGRSRA